MKHLHLRPIEYKKLVNRKFVRGRPESFEFGESRFVKLKDTAKIMSRVFNDPARIHKVCDLGIVIENTKRKIVLVGHGLANEHAYMKRLGFSPENVVDNLDTQRVASLKKSHTPGLSRLLSALSMDATNHHNAGNDAAYTLQALVALAVKDHHDPGCVTRALIAEQAEREGKKMAEKMKSEWAVIAAENRRTEQALGVASGRSTEVGAVAVTSSPDVSTRPSHPSADIVMQHPASDQSHIVQNSASDPTLVARQLGSDHGSLIPKNHDESTLCSARTERKRKHKQPKRASKRYRGGAEEDLTKD